MGKFWSTLGSSLYGITELETLAVVWAVSNFKTYLYSQEVTIYTDHSSVRAVLENPNASGKFARWWIKVYGSGLKKVKIVYRPGKENCCADALSRSPQDPTLAEDTAHISSISARPDENLSDLLQI